MIEMLDLTRLHGPLRGALVGAFERTLGGGRFIGGAAVEAFEGALAAHVDARCAVGTSSGTDALLACLMALGVRPGDEVITTPFTFFATAGSIARLGAVPVFADLAEGEFHLDPRAVEAAITPRTVGIVPVHLFGGTAPVEEIRAVADARGLWVVEDASQGLGARRGGRCVGTFGTAGVYSFFPAKNLGALGDGGAVVTGDPALAEKIRTVRDHGAVRRYRHELVGGNFRLDALQAAFLSVKLPHLRAWEEGRRAVAGRYGAAFAGLGDLQLPSERAHERHVFNQYVVRTKRRDALSNALAAREIASAVYYPEPLHLQPCFAHLGLLKGSYPCAERMCGEVLALPVDPLLTEDELRAVIDAARSVWE